MKRAEINAYGKINLSLDVLGKLDNGYHEVEMVMQQILLHDDVIVRWFEGSNTGEQIEIDLSTNRPFLPKDQRNLAYKAAMVMVESYGAGRSGTIRIDIKKRIPIAAGLAGGSSNCAAVLHGINQLWDLNLTVDELCRMGSALGSDVPFCIMGQAKANPALQLSDDPMAAHCAVAKGTGTELEPIKGLEGYILLTKPPIAVSTQEVYQGLNLSEIKQRPNLEELVEGLHQKNQDAIERNMVNVLENFTLKRYPNVVYTKNNVEKLLSKRKVLMSGSGPTIFALCDSKDEAQHACALLAEENKETFWTKATYG